MRKSTARGSARRSSPPHCALAAFHAGVVSSRGAMVTCSRGATCCCTREARAAKAKVVVIAGPTAVGKSALALRLATTLNGEIVSADSVQVYVGLNVGANKPSAAERAAVPHHLVDIVEPRDGDYSAARFFADARQIVDDILHRGRLPVVVGGTSMYIRWFVLGKPATLAGSEDARHRVAEQLRACKGDWHAALQLLTPLDAERAAKLNENDWYRLQRALEIVYTGGAGVSELPLVGGAPGSTDAPTEQYDFRCFFVVAPREALNRRVDRRCEHMIVERHFLREVAQLLKAGDLRPCSSPARALGYRQTIELFARLAALGEGEPESKQAQATALFREYLDEFMQLSRQYARRQMQWFRHDERFLWLREELEAEDVLDRMLMLVCDEEDVFVKRLRDGSQKQLRQQSIDDGKAMKRYISQRTLLARDSETERRHVGEALTLAGELQAADVVLTAPPKFGADMVRGEAVAEKDTKHSTLQ